MSAIYQLAEIQVPTSNNPFSGLTSLPCQCTESLNELGFLCAGILRHAQALLSCFLCAGILGHARALLSCFLCAGILGHARALLSCFIIAQLIYLH